MAFKDITEVISNIVVIIGLPLAVIQYFNESIKERKDRQYEIYSSMDEKFVEWEKLCLEYPDLDIHDVKDSIQPALTEKQKKQEVILFTILFSIFERAYMLYSDESTQLKKSQWTGWDQYIQDYCKRQNFRKAWNVSGSTFAMEFQSYMEDKMKQTAK
jgi:hypothetical protein